MSKMVKKLLSLNKSTDSPIRLRPGLIKNKNSRKGVALLIVLFIVMVITIIALGVIARGDIELISGRNMELRMAMDYLAESGLEHARGLLLNPQEVSGEYWTGAAGLQLVAGSDDYYDVSVTKLGESNYQITSTAYRTQGSERIGRSSLTAELRLDPCIALWQNDTQPISAQVVVNGDIHNENDWRNYGNINGDVFSKRNISNYSIITGQQYANIVDAPVPLPGLDDDDFRTSYYIGSDVYSVQQLAPGIYEGLFLGPSASNPAGVFYCGGTLELEDTVQINGTLVVKDDLKISVDAVVSITAVKNFPALLVGHDLSMENTGRIVEITGYAQIDHHIDMKNKTGGQLTVSGALYVLGDGIRNTSDCTVDIIAAPNKAAIQKWYSDGTVTHFSPAAGAFFKSITPNP